MIIKVNNSTLDKDASFYLVQIYDNDLALSQETVAICIYIANFFILILYIWYNEVVIHILVILLLILIGIISIVVSIAAFQVVYNMQIWDVQVKFSKMPPILENQSAFLVVTGAQAYSVQRQTSGTRTDPALLLETASSKETTWTSSKVCKKILLARDCFSSSYTVLSN